MRFALAVALLSSMPLLAQEIELKPARVLPLAPQILVSNLLVSEDQTWAVGRRGHFFHWNDGLEQEPFPARQFLTAVEGKGSKLWVVGHDALIMYREGPEQDWQLQYLDAGLEAPLFDVKFQDENLGIAVGAYGLVLLTQDGGQNWTRLEVSEEGPHFYQVKTDEKGHWYLAGEFGFILKLSQAGQVLKRYDASWESTFFGLEVFGEDLFMAYGIRGRLAFFNGNEAKRIENPRVLSIISSTQVGNSIVLVGDGGTVLVFSEHQLTDRSISERIAIVDVAVREKELLLATSMGLRRLNLDEVLP